MKSCRKSFSKIQFLLVLLTGAIFISPGLFSQGSEESKNDAEHSLKNGAWALQFQISQNFTLRDFQGSVLSLKKHLSSKTAIRLGVGVDIQTSDKNSDFNRFAADTLSISSTEDRNEDAQSINLSTQFLYYPSPGKPVKPYWGAGPFIQYGHFKMDRNRISDLTMDQFIENRNRTDWEFGVSTLIGAEWFATSKISLLAEYGVSFVYSTSESRDVTEQIPNDPTMANRKDVTKNNSDGFAIRALPVRFGLSVYW